MNDIEILGPGSNIQSVDVSSIGNLTRAEIDQQIATAHKFPRDIQRFGRDAKALVTVSEEIADECVFGVKRGGEVIVGPSIRFAEIISHCYGNSRQATRIINEGQEFITAQGIFHDLEKNVAFSGEVQRRIVNSKGVRYGVDLIGVTGNAAASIALRNAILRAIPKPLWIGPYLAATAVISGGVRDLSTRRESALIWLEKLGVHPDRVFAALGVRNEAQIDGQTLITLRALIQSVKDNDARLEDVFPRLKDAPAAQADQKTAPNGKAKADLTGRRGGAAAAAGGDTAPAATDAPAEAQTAASGDASPADAAPASEWSADDAEYIGDVNASLAACTTPNEVEAFKDQIGESLQHQTAEVIANVEGQIRAAEERVAKPADDSKSASRKL